MPVDSPKLENSTLTLSQLATKKKEKNCCRIFLNSRDDYLLLYFFLPGTTQMWPTVVRIQQLHSRMGPFYSLLLHSTVRNVILFVS